MIFRTTSVQWIAAFQIIKLLFTRTFGGTRNHGLARTPKVPGVRQQCGGVADDWYPRYLCVLNEEQCK
jgi:hypothetical protein